MIITFDSKDEENQTAKFQLVLTTEELNFLVTFAVESLIQVGAIVVDRASTDPQDVTIGPAAPFIPPTQVN